MFLPLLGERAGVRGNETNSNPPAHDDSQNCQTTRAPRQSWRFPSAAAAGFFIILATMAGQGHGVGKEREWHSENGVRWADLDVPRTGKIGFTLLSPEQTGIRFTNTLDEWQGAANRVLLNGAGVAVGDYDNDGLPDIYFF